MTAANRWGLQMVTIRIMPAAWLTLPAAIMLTDSLGVVFSKSF